jgi:DUF4097 and DUF4098 domain-containing protein YvlB
MCFLELTLLVGQLCNPAARCVLPNTIFGISEITSEFHETYTVDLSIELSVMNVNGDVLIETWDKDHVEVHAIKRTHCDEKELAKVDIEVSIHDFMEVRTRCHEKNAKVAVDYSIRVPRQLVVKEAYTSNGDIVLKGTKGDAKVVTSNGEIDLEDIVGNVRVQTSNGDIEIKGTTAIVEANTSNGSIHVEIRSIPAAGTEIASSNGSIVLYISEAVNADLSAVTSLGRISIEDHAFKDHFTTTAATSTRLKGKIGDGGRPIDVSTSNGSVRLHGLAK